jgi:hypothetical protein
MTMFLPWLAALLMSLSTQSALWISNFSEMGTPKTSFFVMNETQRFMQLDYGMKPILIKRRPKEVLGAWLSKITSDRQLD